MQTTRWISLALVALFFLSCATAPEAVRPGPADAAPAARPAAEEIPLDPAVKHGTLANGLTYYVRENAKPENRAELRLVVNAGSVLEDEDQRGLAHFVEHMAFNGTENFEKQELIEYLERIGMRFGPDINAYTSFDETVYMLQVPTDDEEIVATAFEILEDWAHRVTFEGGEIDKERGVVVEEWRLGRGAWGRIRDKQFPVTFHGSRYAERLPIGQKEILEAAPHDALRRFYRDWYRPDLMAVVAVGDFDAERFEAAIRERFSSLAGPERPRERPEFPVPDHEEALASIVTDPEATSTNVTVGFKRPEPRLDTVEDLRRSLVDALYHQMMMRRLRELAERPDPPYQYAFAAPGPLGRTKAMYRLSAGVRDGGVERGLETLLTEAKRVRRHGFTTTELERSKTDLMRQVERQYEERDKQESSSFAGQYVQHFLEGQPAPSIGYIRDLLREIMPGVTLEEINGRAGAWITEQNRVILVSGPEKEDVALPDEAALLAVFDAAAAREVEPWVDRVRDEPLVAELPEPGEVVEEEVVDELGVTRWTLSNGVTVSLKPTDFKNDEVLLRAFSPGGHGLAADDAYWSASMSGAIAGQMGAGAFSKIELSKALTGKVARVNAYVSELTEGLTGSASPRDLETLFQLAYLRFTAPRRDEDAFDAFLARMRGRLENQEASPSFWFSKELGEALTSGHPRRQPLTADRLSELDLDAALAFYRERFADASDFHFTIVGSFDLAAIRPLVETWLGGLPSSAREESWRDVGVERPDGVVRVEVRRGIEPKSAVRMTFHGAADWSPMEDHLVTAMTRVLRIRLREVLREDMGGVYGVGVYGGLRRDPREEYDVTIAFGCDPGRVDELVAAVLAEIEALKRDGPDEDDVEKVREIMTRERETMIERNGFWSSTLEYHERYGLDPLDILRHAERVAAVTAESVRRVARAYLDTERYVQGVLYPEPDAAASR